MSLTAVLTADTKQFNHAMEGAKHTTEGLKEVLGMVGVGLSVEAVVEKVKQVAEHIDNLDDQAENLTMPIQELQKWQYAAQESGLGAEKFGKALVKLNTLMDEAGNDDKNALAKLAKIELDPSQLKGKSFTDQVGIILDALSAIPDRQEALAKASEIFGTRMGGSVLGLAAKWRELKAEVTDDKLFTDKDVESAKEYAKAMANLDLTIQKLVANSGLIDWLAKAGKLMADMYRITPNKEEYSKAGLDKPIDMAEEGVRKERIAKEVERKQKINVRKDVAELQAQREDKAKPVSQEELDNWKDKNTPDWRKKEKAKVDAENRNQQIKADAEAKLKSEEEKKANEENYKATVKRLEDNDKVKRLGKITGKSGLTQDDKDRLMSVTGMADRLKVEKEITDEKEKQIDLAEQQKKLYESTTKVLGDKLFDTGNNLKQKMGYKGTTAEKMLHDMQEKGVEITGNKNYKVDAKTVDGVTKYSDMLDNLQYAEQMKKIQNPEMQVQTNDLARVGATDMAVGISKDDVNKQIALNSKTQVDLLQKATELLQKIRDEAGTIK